MKKIVKFIMFIFLGISSILIYADDINLARLETTKVYVSSEYVGQSSSFPAKNAIDGNENTVWGSSIKTNDNEPYIFVDLGQKEEIHKIVVKFFDKYHADSVTFAVSNDQKLWLLAPNRGTNYVEVNITSFELKARYIGIKFAKIVNIALGVKEFEVWGTKSQSGGLTMPFFQVNPSNPFNAKVAITKYKLVVNMPVNLPVNKPCRPIIDSSLMPIENNPPYTFYLNEGLHQIAICSNYEVKNEDGKNNLFYFFHWEDAPGITDNPREFLLNKETTLNPIYKEGK